jgi:L-Ala-D/L-Glu epimerase
MLSVVMTAELVTLPLIRPFRIAHGGSSHRIMLRLSHESAVAEAPFVPYYPDDPLAALEALRSLDGPKAELPRTASRSARLALDLLRHELAAQQHEVPLWQHLSLPDPNGKPGCRSLGIPDDLTTFAVEVTALAMQFSLIKLKLGSGDIAYDEQIVTVARQVAPQRTLMADANGGWSVDEAATLIPRLAASGLRLIEQPVHHQLGADGWRALRKQLPACEVSLIADESVQTAADVPEWVGLADGINVKLLKCASLSEALQMIRVSRHHGMGVMLGCMVETQIGISFAAQLAGLADWIDLDGHFYLPQQGPQRVSYDANGSLHLISA